MCEDCCCDVFVVDPAVYETGSGVVDYDDCVRALVRDVGDERIGAGVCESATVGSFRGEGVD